LEEEIERMTRKQSLYSKAKPTRGITAINTTASDLAKEIRSSLTTSFNRAYSNRRSRKN